MTVYVVVYYCGEYSGYFESIERVCVSLERAKEVGRETLKEYANVTDWKFNEEHKFYEMEPVKKRSDCGWPGCYIHVMELDESKET